MVNAITISFSRLEEILLSCLNENDDGNPYDNAESWRRIDGVTFQKEQQLMLLLAEWQAVDALTDGRKAYLT